MLWLLLMIEILHDVIYPKLIKNVVLIIVYSIY